LNHPLKARPIDQFESFFFPREEVAGGLFHVFDNPLCFLPGEFFLLDRNEREIDQEPQKPYPSILLPNGVLFHRYCLLHKPHFLSFSYSLFVA
jgi:hypothetical protein